MRIIKPKFLTLIALPMLMALSIGCGSDQKTPAEVEELRKQNMQRVEAFRQHGPRSSSGK